MEAAVLVLCSGVGISANGWLGLGDRQLYMCDLKAAVSWWLLVGLQRITVASPAWQWLVGVRHHRRGQR